MQNTNERKFVGLCPAGIALDAFAHHLQIWTSVSKKDRTSSGKIVNRVLEVQKEIELEIAHVLFLDIVGYSKVSTDEQHARLSQLNQIVRDSDQSQKAQADNRLLKIPTGDGMALVFYSDEV